MENDMFSLDDLDLYGFHYVHHSPPHAYQEMEASFFGSEDWEEPMSFCSENGLLYQDNAREIENILSKDHLQQLPFSDSRMMETSDMDTVSSLLQTCQESGVLDSTITESSDQSKETNPCQTSLSSVELLKSAFERMTGNRLNEKRIEEACTLVPCQRLSTEEVIRVAGARFVKFYEQKGDGFSMLMHPFDYLLLGLAEEEMKEVELAQLLIASAEKVGNQQFDQASKLLTQCDHLTSSTGTPVQRVVYYFAEALRERINRETGRIPLKYLTKGLNHLEDVEAAMMSLNSELLANHLLVPFCKVLQFAGVQAIIENAASSKRVHLIVIGMKIGLECIILLQALASRCGVPIEHFKVTAIGTRNQEKMEETGKRLAGFAETMNVPFSFNAVVVSEMKLLKKELFQIENDEAVAVYCPFVLRTMIPRHDHLEHLIRVIRTFSPCVMIVLEVEGNHNSPSFANRFTEALFFYSAYFDCLGDCMGRDNQERVITERNYFGQSILNIVSTEGEERVHRHVGINKWRAFFVRFGLVETVLSYSSMYQANLVRKQFSCATSCTFHMNGKSLCVGWKGTPINSVSSWKFHHHV